MNDVRIIGAIALAVMIFICAVGMEWEIKAQNFLLAIIVAAIVDFIVGCVIGPNSPKQKAQGFTGFNCMYSNRSLFYRNNLFLRGKYFLNFFLQWKHLSQIGIAIIDIVNKWTRIFSAFLPFSFQVVSSIWFSFL